eukprot:208873_1
MAEPSKLPSTPHDQRINIHGAKPTTPLLLPPPQIKHTNQNNPSTTSITMKNNASASDIPNRTSSSHHSLNGTHHSHPNLSQTQNQKRNTKPQHRRRPASLTQPATYRQPMLQPNMGPIMNSPLLNPSVFVSSVNSDHTPTMTPINTMHHTDSFSRSLPTHKYTKVITTHPCQPSMDDDEIQHTNDIGRATHEEDQKIVESIHILRDEHNEYHTAQAHTNKSHQFSINLMGSTHGSPPARGIPTTPSYPTPMSAPQQSVRYPVTHSYTHTPTLAAAPLGHHTSTHSIPGLQQQSAPMSTSYRKPSQFMNTQQHRKRTHKLKFTRAKWSEHGKRVLLNTTVRVDRVCHTLVQTRQRFGVCPVEMRELSLTVAVIERAMYSYGRQVQEYKQKANMNRQRTRSGTGRSSSGYYSNSAMHIPHANPTNANNIAATMRLATSIETSISAPNRPYSSLEHHQMEHVSSDDVHSEDSLETIGKCTNTSIVTGTTYVRTHSPMNHAKLARYQRNMTYGNNAASPHIRPVAQQANSGGSKQSSQSVWRHPGGVVSLLEILGRVLRSTEEELIAIGNIASLSDFVQKNKLIWVICFVAGGYIISVPFGGPIQFMLEGVASFYNLVFGSMMPSGAWKGLVFIMNYMIRHVLFRFVPYRFRSRLWQWMRYLVSTMMSMFDRITAIESVSFWMNRFRFLMLPTLIYMIHKMVLRVYLERLAKLENQLKRIILHWQLCMTAITPRHRLDQSLSDRLRRVCPAVDDNESKIDIYEWILRLVLLRHILMRAFGIEPTRD